MILLSSNSLYSHSSYEELAVYKNLASKISQIRYSITLYNKNSI